MAVLLSDNLLMEVFLLQLHGWFVFDKSKQKPLLTCLLFHQETRETGPCMENKYLCGRRVTVSLPRFTCSAWRFKKLSKV